MALYKKPQVVSYLIFKTRRKYIHVALATASLLLTALGLVVMPFSAEQAEIAGCLWQQTRQKGLSLADRACLASAQHMAIPVLTTDRAWAKLGLPLDVRVIR